jgi:iron complex outermembrane receptor protein
MRLPITKKHIHPTQQLEAYEMNLQHTALKHITHSSFGFLILVIALFAFSNGALAQEFEESASSGALEEIVVTARKREENLQEVPISISVFSADDVEAKSLTSLRELSQFAPNLSMYNQGIDGALTNDVLMRGIGNSLGGPGVGIYLDGVYLSTQQAIDLGMLDIERVELLFGPQGTLFGRNTIGGAISYVSKKPTGEFSGTAQLDVGSYDRLDAKVNLNGPLIPGTLNARLALGTQNRDGFMKILDYDTKMQIDELGNRDRWSARLLLDWIVSDDISVLFSLESNEQDEKATARTAAGNMFQVAIHRLYNTLLNVDPPLLGSNMLPPNLYSTYGTYRSGLSNVNYLESTGGSMTVDWTLGNDLSFKSITAYREYHTRFGSDFDFTPHDINTGHNYTDQEQWSQEFQLNGISFDDRMDWVAGLYYFDEWAYDPSVSISYEDLIEIGALADSRRWIKQETTDESWAAFGEGTFDITDKLSATLGLRYTDETKTNYNERTSVSAGGDWHEGGYEIGEGGYNCSACQLPTYGETSIDKTSGRANLSYTWNDDVMTYVSVANGFKSGGLENSVVNPGDKVPTLLGYLPEEVWTYELGLKSTMLDRRLRLNFSTYFSDYTNIQYQFFYSAVENGVPRTVSVVSNAGAAEIKGFELTALYQPVESLTFTASVGHTDAKYTEADVRGGPVTLASKFTRTPEWSYALSGEYRVPTGLGELSARLDYSWVDDVYFDVTNITYPWLQQEAFGLLNGRITLDLNDDWSLSLYGTNLTDEEYIIGAYALLGFGLPALVQPGLPREYGISARLSF